MIRFAVLAGCCVTLAGCGVAAKVNARGEYEQSSSAYKNCLIANSAAPQQCEGLRLAMETDERKFNNMASSLSERTSARNVTVLNR